MDDVDACLAGTAPDPESAVTVVSRVLAIDPGTDRSGWVLLDGRELFGFGIDLNEDVAADIRDQPDHTWVVVERIEPRYGLRMGWETITACEWVGRFTEAAGHRPVALLNRSDVLRHLGIPPKANADSGVRAAMLDRWGGVGASRKGGPLYGVRAHIWSALGIAVAWQEDVRASLIRTAAA